MIVGQENVLICFFRTTSHNWENYGIP